MAIRESLDALLRTTACLEEMGSRSDLENAVYDHSRGRMSDHELATVGEAFICDLDDRGLSNTPEWFIASSMIDGHLQPIAA